MANIFISYNREDEDKTKALVDDIEELGHTVWFDHELSGGQKWWDTILESIRNCDILVFALSVESLNSSACSLEYNYASKLGKTILPVLVGENVSINLLPPELSQIQFVDYRDPDRNALLHLAKALTSAPPSSPLPDTLPLPPEVPISYLGKLGKQIADSDKLSYEEQSALLVDLKRGLHDPETATDTRTLLKKLRKRQHLFENIAREIDELLEDKETIVTPNKDDAILSEPQKKPPNKTMSANTQNSGNSGKLIMFVMVLLLIMGGAGYVYYLPGETQNKVKEEPRSTEEQKLQMKELERFREAEIERQKQEAKAERLRKEKEKNERLQQEEAEIRRQDNIERQKQEDKAERLRKEEIEKLRQEEAQANKEELERLRQKKAERERLAKRSREKVMSYSGEYYGVRGYTDSKRRSPSNECRARYSFEAIIENRIILFTNDGRNFKGSVDGKGNLYIDNRGIRPPTKTSFLVTGPLDDAKMKSGYCGNGYFYLKRK